MSNMFASLLSQSEALACAQVTTTSNVAGLVKDLNGGSNEHKGICGSSGLVGTSCVHKKSSPVQYNFTTFDRTPPAVQHDGSIGPLLACNLTASTTDFVASAPLLIRFDEEIFLGTPSDSIQLVPSTSKGIMQDLSNNNEIAVTISVPSPGSSPIRVTKAGPTLITVAIDASDGTLVSTQWYDVILPQGLVTDASGNPLAKINTGKMCFRMADSTPPFIIGYQPELGATGVSMDPATSYMRLTFNEDVDLGTSSIVLSDTDGSSFIIPQVNITLENSRNTIVIVLPWEAMSQKMTYQASKPNLNLVQEDVQPGAPVSLVAQFAVCC